MSRIHSNKFLNGSSIPKMPSKADIKAAQEKRLKEEKELVEKMNIPPRDEKKYPNPDPEDMKNAGALLYTMNSVASSYDGNLNALIWSYYVKLMYCLRQESGQDELVDLIKSLTNLKTYLVQNKNPLFVKPTEG